MRDVLSPSRSFSFSPEPEQYLSVFATQAYCFKVGLCHLRLTVLSVNISLHRYSVCTRNRNCVLCVIAVEDEEHSLFTCPLYADIRVKLLSDTSQTTTTASLLNVLVGKNKTMHRLARFVFSAMKRRKEFRGPR